MKYRCQLADSLVHILAKFLMAKPLMVIVQPRKTLLWISRVIVVNSIGVIVGGTFAAANIDERYISPELVDQIRGIMLGDKGFMRPLIQEEFEKKGLYLQTPLRENMKDDREVCFLKWMKSTQRLIETVIGQLTETFHIEKVRARDLWHAASRFWRKLLAHTH